MPPDATFHPRASPGGEAAPFVTREALGAWIAQHRIEHVTQLSMHMLAPLVPAPWQPQFRSASSRRRLIELASTDARERWLKETFASAKMRELLPPLAWSFLQAEKAGAEEARASLSQRLAPPEDPRRSLVHGLLLRLRATFPPEVAPRPDRSLDPSSLTLQRSLPGFVWREVHRSEVSAAQSWGFFVPEAELLFSPDAVRGQCSCGKATCIHLLAAIDLALRWLRQPATPELTETLDELVRAPWERTLKELDRILDDVSKTDAAELAWHVDVIEGYGVEVEAYLRRRNKKGQLGRGARVNASALLSAHGGKLSAEDGRLAALLPLRGFPASAAMLQALVGHPQVYLAGTLEPVHVDRAQVGLIAEDRGASVVVTAGVDGTALPPSLLKRLKNSHAEEGHILWEQGSRKLTVLEVAPGLRDALEVLGRQGGEFPPESHRALVEQLSKLARRMPVAMPRSVVGAAVVALQTPVLRLEALPSGQVRLELRTRCFADGPSLVPGEGTRDAYARRDGEPVHAVRDLAREEEAARALQQRLPLQAATALPEPFTFVFSNVQGALALLVAAGELDPAPDLEWVGAAVRLRPRGSVAALRVVLEKRRDWFGALGGLAVEGERVELARLLDAARRKERFVQVDAHSYLEVEEALRAHLERLADHAHVTRHGLEVGPAAVEALAALEDAGATVSADEAWAGLARRIFSAKELRPRVPASLKAELRDYQLEGFKWLTRLASWNAGAVLADDMGLGKTVQALAVLLDRARQGPALVLAPTSVAINWMDEAQRFAPSLRLKLYSEEQDRGLALETLGRRDVLVLTYGLLTRDLERLRAVRFATIVFDEAQTLKNAATQRFKAARALQGDFKFALSGTPFENHLGELWSLFAVVFPGLLGSWEGFRTRFANPIERGVDPTAAPALSRVLQPFLLRRTKLQVENELPPRTDVTVPVVLSPAEWQLYEDARLAAVSDLETRASVLREQERRMEILAALTRLRLLASHPRLYDAASKLESSKLERFLDLVRELGAEGHRALVFSQFTSHLALVREVLDAEGIAYEYLDGQTPQRARAERVRAFQEGVAPLFLISLKAGGFGLNLTAATSVIHLDPWWNPAVEDQASDRAHRIGQDHPVTVYRLVARGTIEEQMLALHVHKRALVTGVLEGKDVAGRLSVKELLALLSSRLDPKGTPTPAQPIH